MDTIEVGKTFSLPDPVTGHVYIGFGSSLDLAIADAIHQWNAAAAQRVRISKIVREYAGGVK